MAMKGTVAGAVVALYALLALLLFPVYPHFPSPNEVTRWMLDAAIVEHRSIEVTSLMPIVGDRFEDVAERDGRIYSNKPPGGALASLPGYLLARPFAGPPSAGSMRATLTAMRLAGATLPLLLLAALLIRLAREYEVAAPRTARVVWIALFATPLFAYGLLGFSHALVAAALFGAWAFLHGLPERRPVHALIAGALLGMAVLSEYPAVIPVAILLAPLVTRRGATRLLRVFAGAAPFALLFALYHHAAFGAPWRLANSYDRLPEYRALAHTAFFGIGLPSPAAALRLLLDPSKGLLLFAPVLALSVPPLIALRRRLDPAAWWTLVLVPLAILLFYSGYPNWHGGWTAGPRYIVPAIPFLAFALLFGRESIAESVLSGWSLFVVTVTALVFPFIPGEFPFPWMSFSLPLLGQGLVAPNAFHLLSPAAAPVLLFTIPLAAAAMILRGRHAAFAVIGILLAVIAGSYGATSAEAPLHRLHRAYVAELHFEREGSLARHFAPAPVPPALLEKKRADSQFPPSRWPWW